MSATREKPAGDASSRPETAAGGRRSLRQVRSVVIEPSKGWLRFPWTDLWDYRELLLFIAWRDIKVRYKQTAIGAAWAILQPLVLMVVFALFVGGFLHVKSDGIPYPVFTFTALLPWTLFSQSLAQSAASLVASANLVAKIYFPRLILPVAATAPFVLDFVIGSVVLAGMIAVYGVTPSAGAFVAPAFALLAIAAALAIGVWLAALNARYRDVQAATPLLIQIWLFASPIAYPISVVPPHWQTVYALNPMATVITGLRWGLLGAPPPTVSMVAASIAMTVIVGIAGLAYFGRTERTFADVI